MRFGPDPVGLSTSRATSLIDLALHRTWPNLIRGECRVVKTVSDWLSLIVRHWNSLHHWSSWDNDEAPIICRVFRLSNQALCLSLLPHDVGYCAVSQPEPCNIGYKRRRQRKMKTRTSLNRLKTISSVFFSCLNVRSWASKWQTMAVMLIAATQIDIIWGTCWIRNNDDKVTSRVSVSPRTVSAMTFAYYWS